MEIQRVRRTSASEAVFEQLLENLLRGEPSEGAALPPERSLTDAFGVNRQAVREALQRLAQAGLVSIQHGGATRALDYRRSASLDLLPRLLIADDGSVDERVVRSIMEMRAAVGPDAARLCAERRTPRTIERLARQAAAMDDAAGLEEIAALDLGFWDVVVDGSDNVAYRLAFNSLRRTYEPVLPVLAPILEDELRAVTTRRRLVEAISEGRAAAAATAAREHLERGTQAITGWLETGSEAGRRQS